MGRDPRPHVAPRYRQRARHRARHSLVQETFDHNSIAATCHQLILLAARSATSNVVSLSSFSDMTVVQLPCCTHTHTHTLQDV